MALQFSPTIGTIVVCDYDTGFRPPEMVKKRLAVAVSPRLPFRDKLCTVVPLSTTPPRSGIRYQCKVELPIDPPEPFAGRLKWAKADMLATVCYDRLDLPRSKTLDGKRIYMKIVLPPDEMAKIRAAMLEALGL